MFFRCPTADLSVELHGRQYSVVKQLKIRQLIILILSELIPLIAYCTPLKIESLLINQLK